MRLLHLAILIISLVVFSVSGADVSDIEVKNLLAIGINNEAPLPFMEFYNAKIDDWIALRTTNINISDYGVAIYKNRLLFLGGFHNLEKNATNVVNEVDLLSGQIKTVNYLNQPRSNPSVAVVGEGKSSALYILGGKLISGAVTATVERWDEATQEWIRVRSMVTPCEGAAVVVHNDDIYVMGGFNGDEYTDVVQVYNIASDMWTVKRSMIEVKGHFHGVSDGRFIFIIGGFGVYSDPNSALNSVDRYNPVNDLWISISNISICSGSVGVNLLNDELYAVGGSYCARTQIYHQNNDTWQFLTPLRYDRSSHTVLKVPFELKDYEFNWTPGNRSMKDILVFGHFNSQTYRQMEVYYPGEGYWQVMTHELTETSDHKAAFVNDRLLIVGGTNNVDFSVSRKVTEISLETGEVHRLSSMTYRRENFGLVTVGEGKSSRLYALGGYGGGSFETYSYLNSVERWDPFTDTWEIILPMNIDRAYMAAVQHKGDIYIFGGHNRAGVLNSSEVFMMDSNKWEFIAPMIHNAYECNAVSDGKYIYVVGGRVQNYVQRYDASTDTWKELAPTTSYGMMGITLLDNSPIVFGGLLDGASSLSDVVEIYDKEKDEWRRLDPMNYKREINSALQIPWKWKYSNRVCPTCDLLT